MHCDLLQHVKVLFAAHLHPLQCVRHDVGTSRVFARQRNCRCAAVACMLWGRPLQVPNAIMHALGWAPCLQVPNAIMKKNFKFAQASGGGGRCGGLPMLGLLGCWAGLYASCSVPVHADALHGHHRVAAVGLARVCGGRLKGGGSFCSALRRTSLDTTACAAAAVLSWPLVFFC